MDRLHILLIRISMNIKDVINRRWLLYPKLQKIGYAHFKTYFGIKVIGGNTINQNNTQPEYIAWPPKGFIMDAIKPKIWSFTMVGADFANANISLKTTDFSKSKNKSVNKLPMVDVNVEILSKLITTHGDDRSILWQFNHPEINDKYEDEDLVYEVSISNVKVGSETKSFSYKVIVIRKA